jgi:hypothetical protein
MFFGVSIYYHIHHDVYRDSIAYAHSPDGITRWRFLGYVIEPFPEPNVQSQPSDRWPTGTVYQLNDPTIVLRGDKLHIAYTSVLWRYPPAPAGKEQRETGCIGLATFRIGPRFRLNLQRRDDRWLVPRLDGPIASCSRPELMARSDRTTTMWFDCDGTLCWIPVSSFSSKLSILNAKRTELHGALDVFVFREGDRLVALANNPRYISACESGDGVKWSAWRPFYRSRAAWARDGLGSPCLFRDAERYELLYFGGVVMKRPGVYDSISIGVAYRRRSQPQTSRTLPGR